MKPARSLGRIGGIVLLVAVISLVGCTLLQPKVAVDFTASKTEGGTPLLVDFTPAVSANVSSYSWDFGDGATSTDSSPVHVYRTPGTYTVSLSVTAADGSTGSIKKNDLIEAKEIKAKEQVSLLYWLDWNDGTISSGDRAGAFAAKRIARYMWNLTDLAVGDGYVYWTDADTIYRAQYDGTGAQAIATNQLGLCSVTVDDVMNQVYWSSWKGFVKRANLNGSNVNTLMTASGAVDHYVRWIRADGSGKRVFWYTDYSTGGIIVPMSLSQDASGNEIEVGIVPALSPRATIRSSMGDVSSMALDASGGPANYVYWTIGSSIKRCRIDGSDAKTILSGLTELRSVAVDLVEGKMYWSDGDGIHRSDLDGTNATLIYPGVRADVLVIQQ